MKKEQFEQQIYASALREQQRKEERARVELEEAQVRLAIEKCKLAYFEENLKQPPLPPEPVVS